jgi:hypothetical protein
VITLPGEFGSRWNARVRNLSRSGMLLEVGSPAEPGVRLKVELDGAVMWGVAAHCRLAMDYWLVGLSLDQPLAALEPWPFFSAQSVSLPSP